VSSEDGEPEQPRATSSSSGGKSRKSPNVQRRRDSAHLALPAAASAVPAAAAAVDGDVGGVVEDLVASVKAEPKLVRARLIGFIRFAKTFTVSFGCGSKRKTTKDKEKKKNGFFSLLFPYLTFSSGQ
jgi:hypothetical protein